MDQDQDFFGALKAVDADEIKARVIHAAIEADQEEDVGQLQQGPIDEVEAMENEIRALQAAISLHEQREEEEKEEEGEQEDNGDAAEEGEEASKPTTRDSLHIALMQRRLSEVVKSKTEVERSREKGLNSSARDSAPSSKLQSRGGALIETSRDVLIRQGHLTPFDRLAGFEKAVAATGQPKALPSKPVLRKPPEWLNRKGISDLEGQLGKHGRTLKEVLDEKRHQIQEIKDARPTAVLLDASDLPRLEPEIRKIPSKFWRAAASGKASASARRSGGGEDRPVASKRKRHVTLPRQARPSLSSSGLKKKSRSIPGQNEEGEEEEEEEEEEEKEEEWDSEEEAGWIQRSQAGSRRRRRKGSKANSSRDNDDDEDDEEEEEWDDEDLSLSERQLLELDAAGDFDDEEDDYYLARIQRYEAEEAARASEAAQAGEEAPPDIAYDGGFSIDGRLHARLFPYQQTAVKWLWELHSLKCGGCLGDEPGLGKTIQLIAYLSGLRKSKMFKPSLIVAPATVLRQWLREIRTWAPEFRVIVLHESARRTSKGKKKLSKAELVGKVTSSASGILLTTYESLRLNRNLLLPIKWGVACLDEGHKIRNPDAEITLVAKQLKTVHRLILSGTPIQNRLSELWSLFDYLFPGRLGTLPIFQAQFSLPIQAGAYSNASPLQVSTAHQCAVVLRDLIAPYLLRRRKCDVNTQLPKKTEQVLFCSLTLDQVALYRSYISSEEVQAIIMAEPGKGGKSKALAGIDILRKITNHPDLLERSTKSEASEYGSIEKSGKMKVLDRLLEHWSQAGHKALLFCQTQQMLDIVEKMVRSRDYNYHRMDGSTSVVMRSRLMDDFNNNPDVFLFLLTTKVGGLGINLTGANRILLYDPDWNPSSDAQARERAWRIGQTREVAIYRLITSGTIEEKVYHRQIYKGFLTERILTDPRQKRFFTSKDISDLFTLGEEYKLTEDERAAQGDEPKTETARIFESLDGRGVELLPPEEEEEHEEEEDEEEERQNGSLNKAVKEEDDSRILRDLFEGRGMVHSSVDHSRIEAANDPTRLAIDREAAKVAKRAADMLKSSRSMCLSNPVSVPTWTGRSGSSGSASAPPSSFSRSSVSGLGGGPGKKPRFGGGSSSLLLSQIHQKKADHQAALSSEVRSSGAGSSEESQALDEASSLLAALISYLDGRGGQAPTADLVESFSVKVPPRSMPLFKQTLKQVAVLKRGEGGGKVWILREEFK